MIDFGLLTTHSADIHQWKDGKSTVFRTDARGNGLLFDANGRLLCCEPGRKRVTRSDRDGKLKVLTDQFRGNPYNTPNDITIDRRGRILFSDPRYGNRDDMGQRDASGAPIEGVYSIAPDLSVRRLITHEVDRPNGVLISNDQKHLYVADNNNDTVGGSHRLFRFDYDVDTGNIDLESQELLFDWGSCRGPDGMVQARNGTLYVAAGRTTAKPPNETIEVFSGGIYAFSPDGKLLDFKPVPTDEVTNCTIGGKAGDTLFVTAGGELWAVPLPRR